MARKMTFCAYRRICFVKLRERAADIASRIISANEIEQSAKEDEALIDLIQEALLDEHEKARAAGRGWAWHCTVCGTTRGE